MKNLTPPLGGERINIVVQTAEGFRYLTKSRFKQALDCPSKLFYCNKPNEYADDALDDPFLAALAEGGFQVGELAKFLFCEDPITEKITIDEKGYDEAIAI